MLDTPKTTQELDKDKETTQTQTARVRACSSGSTDSSDPPSYPDNSIDAFESTFSPTCQAVLALYGEKCGQAKRSFARDANTREGARRLALEVDGGAVTLEALGGAFEKILSDPKKKDWGLKGIAANYGNHLPPPEASAGKAGKQVPWVFKCDVCAKTASRYLPENAPTPQPIQCVAAVLGCQGTMQPEDQS